MISDVSGGEQAAEAVLRRSQVELAEAQRLAKYGSWTLELVTGKLVWSDELYRIFGVESSSFTPSYDAFLNLVATGDKARVTEVSANARANGETFEVEYQILTPAGELRVIREVGRAVRGGAGEVTRLHGTAQDVTAAVAAAKELRNSEQRLRILFEYAPDAIYLHELEGVLVDGNKAAEKLVGYSRLELIGKNLFELDLLDAEAMPSVAQALALNAKGQSSGPDEYKLKRKDGSHVAAEIRSFPVTIEGKVLVLGIARDITERKQAWEELRVSEEQFRSVWEHSIDGMRLIDKGGRIIAVNGAYCNLVKLPRERLLGQLFTVVYEEMDREKVLADYEQRFTEGRKLAHLQRSVRLWNSEELDLDITASIIASGQGSRLMLSLFRDVTESRRAEQQTAAFSSLGQRLSAAKTAQEAGELIIEVADQLLGWDACFFCLYSAAEDKIRHIIERDKTVGHQPPSIPDYDNQPPSAYLRRAILLGGQLLLKPNVHEMAPGSVPFGDASRPSASILCVPIRDGTQVIGVLSIQSYTPNAYEEHSLKTLQALADHCAGALERIKSQEALQETQKRLNHLVEESPAVIFSLSLQGAGFRPVWVSNSIQQMLGYTSGEACLAEWWKKAVHPEDHAGLSDRVEILLSQKHLIREYRIRHKNGEYRWIRDERRLVSDKENRPVEAVGSWVDITERKGLEDLLRQAQKMEAIGLLAGGVAHDFNNLLAVMRGNAELLLLDADQLSEPSREGLHQIISPAERSANLTRQLLAFSRKQVMQSQPLVLNEVIGNLTKMLKRIIGENIELQCHYQANLPYVQADAGMIEQVVVNLVVNARDAMPRGGQLHIGTDTCHITDAYVRAQPEARVGEFVCLTVRDTGTGIPQEHLPRIFEPFFTTKELGKGTGLGLATVYGIAKQHQGWVEVSSQPGQGAAFRLFLPAIAAPAGGRVTATAEPPIRGGSETILLVEDEFAVRLITRRVLESVGYKVQEASCPREALEIWQRMGEKISLLLTDIVMPEGTTGRELADQIRMQRPKLKVIFMSGYNPEVAGKDTDFFKRTNSYFLQKPCPSRVLLKTVRQCLEREL